MTREEALREALREALKEENKAYDLAREEVLAFKERILSNIDDIEIDFEVGYCYKRSNECCWDKNSYWVQCYYFLKGLAHYHSVKCWC